MVIKAIRSAQLHVMSSFGTGDHLMGYRMAQPDYTSHLFTLYTLMELENDVDVERWTKETLWQAYEERPVNPMELLLEWLREKIEDWS